MSDTLVLASAASTTGIFVLAGVVVGGLVTGAVNYVFEWRRERARVRVAVRLLEAELLAAGASADLRLEQAAWSPWNFESAHRTWSEYRPDIAGLPAADWYAVSLGFYAIDMIERSFSSHPVAGKLDPGEQKLLNGWSEAITEGANALQRRQGLNEIARFGGPEGERNTRNDESEG